MAEKKTSQPQHEMPQVMDLLQPSLDAWRQWTEQGLEQMNGWMGELSKLEDAMMTDLGDSAHGEAARGVPLLVALVNGFAPLAISLVILIPLLVANAGLELPVSPLYAAVATALLLLFLLGVFLGSIAGVSWLRSGIQTLLVAILTAAFIYLFAGY